MKYFKLVGILVSFFGGCSTDKSTYDQLSFPENYSIKEVKKVFLPDELEEISGLEWVGQDQLWAIEDESSIIYQINPVTGKIINKQKFAKNRDIEDLSVIGNTAWVLQSNGTLYKIEAPFTNNPKTSSYKFPLKGKKDMEALVTFGTEPSLLVFCKACSWDEGPDQASVFKFDLEKEDFESTPLMILKRDTLITGDSEAIKSLKIQPSAAAIHPLDQSIYVISSTGKWLMILDQKGIIQQIHQLDPFLFKQPEGLTFDPLGNLYISNEAKDGRPNILIFPYHP